MEGSAAVSDASLVSPPPMDLEEPRPPPARISELFAAPNPASLQSTPSGSPARRTEASVAQHGQQTQKPPATPATASSGSSQRSGSDAEPALADGEKASANGQLAAQNGAAGEQAAGQTADSANGEQSQMQNAASKQIESAEPKPVKTWFEVISMVLQNFRTHEREQIKRTWR
ncbi:unnamed protein product [Phytophthora lilii]|uniref:Unnamed protein product n=1 Tax=Phytophthora lilii TaxID=2077276 RepID=A0A9W6X2V2_9STRA|nr:unnamed protein product [Phytophthora lilii]